MALFQNLAYHRELMFSSMIIPPTFWLLLTSSAPRVIAEQSLAGWHSCQQILQLRSTSVMSNIKPLVKIPNTKSLFRIPSDRQRCITRLLQQCHIKEKLTGLFNRGWRSTCDWLSLVMRLNYLTTESRRIASDIIELSGYDTIKHTVIATHVFSQSLYEDAWKPNIWPLLLCCFSSKPCPSPLLLGSGSNLDLYEL